MTHASWHGEAGQGVIGPRAIVLRLIVALALVLFGAPQSHTDRMLAHAGPVAESVVEQAKAVLSVQRHLLRAEIPNGDAPDVVARSTGDHIRQRLFAASMSTASKLSFLPLAFHILPPVRGPPVA